MRLRARVAVAAVLGVALVAAGCGSSETLTGKVVKDAGVSCVQPKSVPTADGKPTGIKVPTKPSISKAVTTDLKAGTGAAAKAGDELTLQLFVVSCSSGQQVFSTWDQAPAPTTTTTTAPGDTTPAAGTPVTPTGPQKLVLEKPAALQGMVDGLTGMKVGGQRQIVIPPGLGMGSAGGNLPIGGSATASDTLIYVVQLDATGPAAAACADSPLSNDDPKIPPTVAIKPGSTVPPKLVTKDLIPGSGTAIKAGDKFTVNYTGYVCSTGQKFDSSWDRGTPLQGSLDVQGIIQGWVDGVPGMMAGGRRMLVIPPSLAYKDKANGGIPANSTLVFVIDMITVGA